MKRLLWLVLLGIVTGVALTAVAKQSDSNSAQTESAKKHKRHRHHKNPHKGHLDMDQYPTAGV